jgi:hypothetical protein
MWRLYQLIPVVGLVILTLMRGGAGCFSPRSLSGPNKTSSALRVACLLSFEDFRTLSGSIRLGLEAPPDEDRQP